MEEQGNNEERTVVIGFTAGYDFAFEKAQNKCAEVSIAVPLSVKNVGRVFAENGIRAFQIEVDNDRDNPFYEGIQRFLSDLALAIRAAEDDIRKKAKPKQVFSIDLNATDDFLIGR